MYDIRDAQAAYQQATVDWKNSRFTDLSRGTVLNEYKRAVAFVPELIEEVQRLQTELKGKN